MYDIFFVIIRYNFYHYMILFLSYDIRERADLEQHDEEAAEQVRREDHDEDGAVMIFMI